MKVPVYLSMRSVPNGTNELIERILCTLRFKFTA